MESPIQSNRIIIVAVGATGQGKSTLGNVLASFQSPPFVTSDSFDSQTRLCCHVDFDVDGVSYRFVDTVGFFDTKMTPAMVYEKFSEFADRAPDGVHVFLYLEQKGRFNDEQARRFNVFKEYVGTEALQNTILTFTRVDDEQLRSQLKRDEEENRIPSQLRDTLNQVNDTVGVDSVGNPAMARTTIIQAVNKLLQNNGGVTYSNQPLKEAFARRQELQSIVDHLPHGERKTSMLHALKGLYDGSRTYDEVRGTVMHAQVMEEKEQLEKQLHELKLQKAAVDQAKADIEVQYLKADNEVRRLFEEQALMKEEREREQLEHKVHLKEQEQNLENERKEHKKQEEDLKQLHREECADAEKKMRSLEEEHLHALRQQQEEVRLAKQESEKQKLHIKKIEEELVVHKTQMDSDHKMFSAQQKILSQQRFDKELLERREKILGAALVGCILIEGFRWMRR